jgi:hypothetical protein
MKKQIPDIFEENGREVKGKYKKIFIRLREGKSEKIEKKMVCTNHR